MGIFWGGAFKEDPWSILIDIKHIHIGHQIMDLLSIAQN